MRYVITLTKITFQIGLTSLLILSVVPNGSNENNPSGSQTTGLTDDVSMNDMSGQRANTGQSSGSSAAVNDTSLTTVSGVARVNATTKFIDDDDTVTKDESHDLSVSDLWNKLNDTQEVPQSLHDFFLKPFTLMNGSFSIADVGTTIVSKTMPFDFFQDPTAEMWVDKLKGFTGARFDMRFRLVINANKFQQGRYIMAWIPYMGSGMNAAKRTWFFNMHMATIHQRTTLTHVEIDINTETSAELLVPFQSVSTYFDFRNGLYTTSSAQQLGSIALYPYTALISPTGSTVVPYKVYLSFENVRLFGSATAQSGIGRAENAMKFSGPISSIANSFARGFKEFSNIPLLSTYAKSAQWVADRTARAASIFGFAKPTGGDNITKMMLLNNPGHSNVDGTIDSRSLGFMQLPATVPLDGQSGSDTDEMDFSTIVRRYAFLQSTNWTTGQTADTLLLNIQITPAKFVNFGGFRHYLPVGFVTSFFQFWRGSMKIRIKLAKTVFHSGRLAFYFTPDGSGAASVNQWYFNRQIVDVREHNEFEIIVPYMSFSPYTSTGAGIGELRVVIVDPLVAPSSVSSTVAVLVEMAGGDDLEFGGYSPNYVIPSTATPQSGLGGAGEDKCVCFTIGNSSVGYHPTLASQTSMGDKVSSFRVLLKKFTALYPSNRTGTVRTNYSGEWMTVDMIPCNPTVVAHHYLPDLLGIVASAYGAWSGGIRIKDVITTGLFTAPANPTISNMVSTVLAPATTVSFTKPFDGSNGLVSFPLQHQTVLQQININNTISVEVPQYTATISRAVADCMSDQGIVGTNFIASGFSMTGYVVNINMPMGLGVPANTVEVADTHNFFRAMADDGNLSVFISIPPMLIFTGDGKTAFW